MEWDWRGVVVQAAEGEEVDGRGRRCEVGVSGHCKDGMRCSVREIRSEGGGRALRLPPSKAADE